MVVSKLSKEKFRHSLQQPMHQSDPSSIPSGHCPAPQCYGTSPGQAWDPEA